MQVAFILQQLAAAATEDGTKWIMGSDWQRLLRRQLKYCQGAQFEHGAKHPVQCPVQSRMRHFVVVVRFPFLSQLVATMSALKLVNRA